MEKHIFIKQVFPLQERQYTAQSGEQRTFASRGILFSTGIDEIYGEATGDLARALPDEFDLGKLYSIQGTMRARQWQDQNGRTHFDNQLVITKIA
jgi:hypothetical protein